MGHLKISQIKGAYKPSAKQGKAFYTAPSVPDRVNKWEPRTVNKGLQKPKPEGIRFDFFDHSLFTHKSIDLKIKDLKG